MRLRLIGVIVLILVLPAPALSDQFDDGQTAFDRKEYATALGFWQPLADEGNVKAQGRIGNLYLHGRGVPKDYTEAMK